MKILRCSKVCCGDCDYVASGNSDRVIIRGLLLHGEKKHSEIMEDLDDHSLKIIMLKMHDLIEVN